MPSDIDALLRALHAAAQAYYAQNPGAHAPGLDDPGALPTDIGAAWTALARQADVDHALLCPAFSFVLHRDGLHFQEGTGTMLPPDELLPQQRDPEILGLCTRALDLLPAPSTLLLDVHPTSAHQRLLFAQLAPPPSALFGYLLRSRRVCAFFSFFHSDPTAGRLRLAAAVRR